MPSLYTYENSQEKKCLLVAQSDDECSDVSDDPSVENRRRRSALSPWLLGSSIVGACYGLLVTALLIHGSVRCKYTGARLIYTPAREVMSYGIKGAIETYPDEYHQDPFFGDPSPQLDQRWVDRLRYATIRLSAEEMTHYDQKGILLGDGSGYLATPTAYHDLHCIRLLHENIYPRYYFPNETEEEKLSREGHTRHCLHNLFHSVTCNADMTIRVMRWHPHSLLPSPVDHEHECMDWERIDEWARQRYVDTGTSGLLVHPTKGEVFPRGYM